MQDPLMFENLPSWEWLLYKRCQETLMIRRLYPCVSNSYGREMNGTFGKFLVNPQLSEEEDIKLPEKEKLAKQSLGMPAGTWCF